MAKNYKLALEVEERNNEARLAEQDDDLNKAVKLYEQNIKEDYADEFAFERLMIIYRKLKEYEDELRVINRAIKLFQKSMEDHLKHSLARHIDGKKLERISNAIMKKSGLKKEEVHFPDPIDKWIKRKEIAEQKLENNQN
jgi:tetratricopeptide (TPR) repeat protein